MKIPGGSFALHPLPVFSGMLATNWLTQQDRSLSECGIWRKPKHGNVDEAVKQQLRLEFTETHELCLFRLCLCPARV